MVNIFLICTTLTFLFLSRKFAPIQAISCKNCVSITGDFANCVAAKKPGVDLTEYSLDDAQADQSPTEIPNADVCGAITYLVQQPSKNITVLNLYGLILTPEEKNNTFIPDFAKDSNSDGICFYRNGGNVQTQDLSKHVNFKNSHLISFRDCYCFTDLCNLDSLFGL